MDGIAVGREALFLLLDLFPVEQDLFGSLCLGVTKNMGMTGDQLFAYAVNGIVDVKGTLLFGHIGMVYALEDNIAQLFTQQGIILQIDGLYCLVNFFDEVLADALMGLLSIPGAAIFAAQDIHDLQQILEVVFGLAFKTYHKTFPFASIIGFSA